MFKVHPGKLEEFKAALPAFVEPPSVPLPRDYGVPGKTANEEKNLFYGFSVNGDEVFCREAYTDSEGLLPHLDKVAALSTDVSTN